MIKDFLVNNDGRWILKEFENTHGLTDHTRKRLITLIANFAVELFGLKPNGKQKTIVSMAVIELFPTLGPDGEIVNIYKQISALSQSFFNVVIIYSRTCYITQKVVILITS